MTLENDPDHFRTTHDRWTQSGHRSDSEHQDEQCGLCRFYVPLSGRFAEDWGACTNPASPCDKGVLFEHDGCEAFAWRSKEN